MSSLSKRSSPTVPPSTPRGGGSLLTFKTFSFTYTYHRSGHTFVSLAYGDMIMLTKIISAASTAVLAVATGGLSVVLSPLFAIPAVASVWVTVKTISAMNSTDDQPVSFTGSMVSNEVITGGGKVTITVAAFIAVVCVVNPVSAVGLPLMLMHICNYAGLVYIATYVAGLARSIFRQ